MNAPLLMETDGSVLVIRLNRPAVRNAVNAELAQALSDALGRLARSPDLRAAVLTGEGGHFCAGMDLKAFTQGERPVAGRGGFAGMVEQPPAKPIVAAVEGYAVAGGFEIALACDLIVAADTSRFGLPEVKRGLVASAGGLMRLPRRLPYHLAMELALTGEPIPATQALAHGLVNRVVPAGQALEQALVLARSIAANAPLAVAASKRIVAESHAWPSAQMFALQAPIADPVVLSEDAREGALAFAQKRSPVWQGR